MSIRGYLITDIDENELHEGDRVQEPFGDSFPRIGTVDTLYDGAGCVWVVWDGDSEAHAILPTRLRVVND